MFTTKHRLNFHDLHRETHGLGFGTDSRKFRVHEAITCSRPCIHVFHGCHAQNSTIRVEGVILATRVVYVLQHLMATDAL